MKKLLLSLMVILMMGSTRECRNGHGQNHSIIMDLAEGMVMIAKKGKNHFPNQHHSIERLIGGFGLSLKQVKSPQTQPTGSFQGSLAIFTKKKKEDL